MTTRKTIWDALDELEGKEKGESYKNLKKERKRQGYREESLDKFGELIE